MSRRAGASARPRRTATAASGTTTPGARLWARPRRPATPPGSTTPAVGPSAAQPPRARWHSREGSGLRASIHSDLINHRKESAVPALSAKGPGRHPFAALWQQQTNLWRKVANPAQGTTRRSPRAARSSQERPRLAGKESACYGATTMFVHFRETPYGLAMSVVENRRENGKVRHEHVVSLGSIETPPSVAARVEFWRELHERLAELSNR